MTWFLFFRCLVLQKETCLDITVRAMERDPTLLDRYRDDFIRRKLHLEALSGANTRLIDQLLQSYTGDLKAGESKDILARLAQLHIRLHVRGLNLTRVTTILRPFSRVQLMEDQLTPDSPKEGPLEFKVPQPEAPVGVIVDHIFQFVKKASGKLPGERAKRLNMFFKRYNDLVSQNVV